MAAAAPVAAAAPRSAAMPAVAAPAPLAARNGHAVGAPALNGDGGGLLARLFGRAPAQRGPHADICVELHRRDETIVVRWPARYGEQCAGWLRDYLK